MNTVFSGTWNVKESHVCYHFDGVLHSALCQDNACADRNLSLATLECLETPSTLHFFSDRISKDVVKVTMWLERFLCLFSALTN